MTELPRLVQRAPTFFYAAAVIYFLGSVLLTHFQIENSFRGVESDTDPYTRLVLVHAWLQAAEVSLYLADNGVLAHILLAIWRQGQRPPDQEEDE